MQTDRTQEIRAEDILESVELEVDVPVYFDAAPSRERPQSVAPFAIDLPPQRRRLDSTVLVRAVSGGAEPRRLRGVVVGVLSGACLILLAGIARRATSGPDEPVVRAGASALAPGAFVASRAASPVASPAPSLRAADLPEVDVGSLPVDPVGTIRGPSKRRLVVDGKLLAGSSAVVSCGRHSVRIAGARKSRWVDVPCGGELRVR